MSWSDVGEMFWKQQMFCDASVVMTIGSCFGKKLGDLWWWFVALMRGWIFYKVKKKVKRIYKQIFRNIFEFNSFQLKLSKPWIFTLNSRSLLKTETCTTCIVFQTLSTLNFVPSSYIFALLLFVTKSHYSNKCLFNTN